MESLYAKRAESYKGYNYNTGYALTIVEVDIFPTLQCLFFETLKNFQAKASRSINHVQLHTANVYRQTTDELMFKSIISTKR